MSCPFCLQAFATATGVTHHVERDSCPNARNINRDELYKLIRAKDPGGRISKNLVRWNASSHYEEATDNAWNGFAWECYFCHREFNSSASLNQHLSSPFRT